MSLNSAGRPQKVESSKRKQLQISLYAEDIERLEALTDNRSEFIRECIAKSWAEKNDGDQTITLTIPKWLIRALLDLLKERLPPSRATLVHALVEELLSSNDHFPIEKS